MRRFSHVATRSCPVIGMSPTLRDVGRPPTGKTPIQRLRMELFKWGRLIKTARAEGKTASEVINDLTDWYLRDRPTSQLTRPARQDLTDEEKAEILARRQARQQRAASTDDD